MNIEQAWNQVSTAELENVTGGRMILVHKRVEMALNALIKQDAGNVSDYVGEFGVEGRIPYVGK